ncbi:LuxR C-terminal-related transcriptional regulator [Nocardioides maradonensis]
MADWLAEHAALSAAEADLPPADVERLAVAAAMLGRDDEVVRLREEAFEAYLAQGQTEAAAECAFWLIFNLDNRGEHAQASGWTARVARLVPEGSCLRVASWLAQRQAVLAMFSGECAAALPLFEQGAEVAARRGDLDGLVLAGLGRGRCLAMLGRTKESAEAYDEVMVHVVAGRVDPQVTGLAYCAIVAICMEWFDLRRAQEWTHTFAEWAARQHGMVAYRGTCLVHRAEILQLRGAWPDARAEAQSACEVLAGDGAGAQGVGEAHYRVAELARLRGMLDVAEDAYARALALGHEVQPGLGLLRLAQGRAGAAAAGLDRALAEDARPRQRALLLAARVEVALGGGDLETAQERAAELAGLAATLDADYLTGLAEHATGALLLARGDAAAALPHLRRAWTRWQQCEAPYESARARVLVARACGSLGDEDACRMELAAARAVLEELGAAYDLAGLCDDGDSADGPLTPREREVLRLIATGATNRAIAERLVLSERTVARHVSNIFTKLGLASRAAATAYAYEHGLA